MKTIEIDCETVYIPDECTIKEHGKDSTKLVLSENAKHVFENADILIYEVENQTTGAVKYLMDGNLVSEKLISEAVVNRWLEEAYDMICSIQTKAIRKLKTEYDEYFNQFANIKFSEMDTNDIWQCSTYRTIMNFIDLGIVELTDERAENVLNTEHPLEELFKTMYDPFLHKVEADHIPLGASEGEAIEGSLDVLGSEPDEWSKPL